jgi:hypothetical protein
MFWQPAGPRASTSSTWADVIAMTIERQWLEIFKSEVPDAFSDEAPFPCDVGFIDAQIKLMAMPHEHEWDAFLEKQFRKPVTAMFALGARTVVLAFDDYENVPRAKAITQAKRRTGLTPYDFKEGDPLPERPPHPWNAAMANRAFKARVIEFIAGELPELFKDMPTGLAIVVDWKGKSAARLTADGEGNIMVAHEDRKAVGEADLKFRDWAERSRDLVLAAEAIDGDFVPIALGSR